MLMVTDGLESKMTFPQTLPRWLLTKHKSSIQETQGAAHWVACGASWQRPSAWCGLAGRSKDGVCNPWGDLPPLWMPFRSAPALPAKEFEAESSSQ